MKTKIQKWGNSLAVRLPHVFAKEARLAYGSDVEITVDDGRIVIENRQKGAYSLDELLEEVRPDNLHAEQGMGKPVGREEW